MTEETERSAQLSARDWSIIAAQAANKKKATDIVVQEVRELIGETDFFVIVTAANNRQVNAIIDAIEEDLRVQANVKPLHREETRDGSWELLDYGSMIVHVFQPETRDYYRLESLWNDAPLMDLVTEAGITDAVYSDRIAALFSKVEGSLEEEALEEESLKGALEEGALEESTPEQD